MTSAPQVQLGDIALVNPALNVAIPPDDQVAFIPMAAVDASSVEVVERDWRSYSKVSKGYTSFTGGDVLVAKITPCFENGKIAIASITRPFGFGSTEFHVIRPDEQVVDRRYLVHFLRQESVRRAGTSRMTGSAGQRRVPEQFLRELRVPLPAMQEQGKIADILDKADALRAKRRAALAKLDVLREMLFLDMFGDPATNPQRWPIHRVSELVVQFQGGKSIEANDEGTLTNNRILKVSAVTGMAYRPLESKPVSNTYVPPPEHFVQRGDLLFSRANTTDLVGAVAYVWDTPPNLLLPDKLWRFVWREGRADALYIWALFQTPHVRSELGRRATGTSGSMKNISQEKVLSIPVIVPPIALQREFARRLVMVEKVRASCLKSDDNLNSLFSSLQHRAFATS